MNPAVAENEPLWHNTQSALIFAYNYSGYPARPLLYRLGTPTHQGKGLSGLDGAAQAGMIRAEVATLGPIAEAVFIARFAPHSTPCSCRAACCSGQRPNAEWVFAISKLTDYVHTTALAGCTANGALRREYVVRYFSRRKEERVPLESIAERHGVHRDTASAQAARVAVLFSGERVARNNSKPGIETIATNTIDERLREIGMVG